MLPWSADPEIARMMRSGDVAYERLRPLDTYAFWYARAVARRTAVPLLRAIPMVMTAGILFRLLGLSEWALSPPPTIAAAATFAASMVLVVALSAAVATLMDILAVATLSDRGVNTMIGPLIIVFSGQPDPAAAVPDLDAAGTRDAAVRWARSTYRFASTARI